MDKGKVVSLEDRIPKLKEQRRKKANRRLIFLLLLFFLIIVCVIYFQSPLSHVKNIEITGNHLYTYEDLEKMSGINSNTNIWTIKKDKLAEKLKDTGGIKSAKISIAIPNTVHIDVKEYRKIAYFEVKNKFIPLLENGDMLHDRAMTNSPYDAPIIKDMKSEDERVITKIGEELSNLSAEVYNAISEIRYTPKNTDKWHVTIYMNDGNQVLASLSSFSDKMKHYPSIIAQLNTDKKGVIDLEVGSYFKAFESEGEKEE
ncbi:FtsQ-type POTRA domain-containing protein [Cytobacillus oceanisediminis]|uniref:cell division protein FtsQ/DivIB n=1 Tax=Bacillaceae TaxID=186817 RepID=UPI001CCC3BED|nr:FtsQ-type POTRA domain-containing protein [Cytobacillus oceanisediminis]MBQ6445988.1 FtsQ-type POTRA domain-containing protein [Bacillus sp. (in: firmicutes)]MBZ9535471.1 FtsQ-type POTRA domain-containing protein [Cytobacillus oceanisediminis]